MGPVWFTLPLSFKESSHFLMHLSILASLTRHNSWLATVAVLTKQIAAFLYGELSSCKSHQLFSTMAKMLYEWSAHRLCYNLCKKNWGSGFCIIICLFCIPFLCYVTLTRLTLLTFMKRECFLYCTFIQNLFVRLMLIQDGRTSLHICCIKGKVKMVKLLIDRGCDVKAKDKVCFLGNGLLRQLPVCTCTEATLVTCSSDHTYIIFNRTKINGYLWLYICFCEVV